MRPTVDRVFDFTDVNAIILMRRTLLSSSAKRNTTSLHAAINAIDAITKECRQHVVARGVSVIEVAAATQRMFSNNSLTVSNLFRFRVKRQRGAQFFGTKINFVFIKCSGISQCRRRVTAIEGASVVIEFFCKSFQAPARLQVRRFTRRTFR
jgi:hypothetical protein